MRSVVLLITILLGNGVAFSQDACVALIQNAMYDYISTSNSQLTNSQQRSAFCSWYSTYRTSHQGAAGSLGIPINDIPINVGGNYTFDSADAMNQAMCQNSAAANGSDARFQSVQQYIDPNAATAFSACVKAQQQGLSGNAFISDDNTTFTIQLIYIPPPGVLTGTTIRNVAITPPDAFTCPNPASGTDIRTLVGQQKGFNNAYASLTCQRTIVSPPVIVGPQTISAKSGLITINTDAGTYSQTFRAIPAANPLSSTEQVMAAMPRGTILVWAGQASDMPKGWQLCDGTNGTPDLNHRIPRGTLAVGEVRGKDGAPDHTHGYSGTTSSPSGAHNTNVKQENNNPYDGTGWDHTHSYSGTTTGASSTLPEITYVMYYMKIQ